MFVVAGWSPAELRALRDADWTTDDWQRVLRIHVAGADGPPVAARYTIGRATIEATPTFPLDAGRAYVVRIDPGQLPAPRAEAAVTTTLTVPDSTAAVTTTVTRIFPSASTWPENTLRFYLHFSGPMSGTSAVGQVRLEDAEGREVRDALLEVDVDLWNGDYTRRTVFFDPGRVKQDIKPNRDLGRALVAGRRYAIVVSREWRDARGQRLVRDFRHAFTAGPALTRGLDPSAWSLTAPQAGSTDPLRVTFPWPLDEGLLHRAVGVMGPGEHPVAGLIGIGDGERSWTFTPASPWRAAPHTLVVLSLLEDPAGNTVGEPFEFEMFGRPAPAAPERTTLPFTPRK